MNIAVLMLYCSPEGRSTNFTKNWCERAMQLVSDYYKTQSAGLENITYTVFDWVDLGITAQQWSDLGMGAYASLQTSIEAKIGASLAGYDHIMIAIDHPQSSGGTTPGNFTYLAAINFTPSLICHELGHRYGAADAYGDTPKGPDIYNDHFCVMGAEGWPYVFRHPTLTDQNLTGLNEVGPNMCTPTLLATGWMKENQPGIVDDFTHHNIISSFALSAELSALAGAPGPNWSRPPLFLRYGSWMLEYRVPLTGGWDLGLPSIEPQGEGWLVLHHAAAGLSTVIFDAIPAVPGSGIGFGQDNIYDIFNPGPVRATVMAIDRANHTVRVGLSQRAAMQPPSGITFGGVDVGGGGWVWTPGRGLKKVPPHSPLVEVLDAVTRLSDLQDLMDALPEDQRVDLVAEASRNVAELQRQIADFDPEVLPSPLGSALTRVAQLEAGLERQPASNEPEASRRMFDENRRQVAEIRSLLQTAIEAERSPR